MVLTLQERVEIVFMYGENARSARATARQFNERHPGMNVSHNTVIKLVSKFSETGSVANRKGRENRVVDELAQTEVLGLLSIDPQTSIRKVAAETGLSYSSVRKVTKIHKWHPYKVKILHELHEDDFDRRIQFCEEIIALCEGNDSQLGNICFSDECTFFLNGFVNTQNCRYWAPENPHVFVEGNSQWPQKLNVWAGIFGDTIVGPLFIDGNLNGDVYHNLLQEYIHPLIVDLIENAVNDGGELQYDEPNVYFQQDGAPPHYSIINREWLNDHYPDRWIGRRGPIEWPARSPDLTPMDFFLWGHLKSVVYKTPPADLQDLRNRIVQECRAIPRETFQKVRLEFQNRLFYCMERNGEHFEHLL